MSISVLSICNIFHKHQRSVDYDTAILFINKQQKRFSLADKIHISLLVLIVLLSKKAHLINQELVPFYMQ